MSVQDVYDISGAIEAAAAAVFRAAPASLTVFTPQSDPKFQQVRPRAEIICVRGAGLRRMAIVNNEGATLEDAREQAWKCRLQIETITEATIQDHTAYNCQIMNLMAKFAKTINGANLPNHCILFPIYDLGAVPTFKPQDGFYHTVMNHEFSVSIQANKWALITS